MSGPGAGPWAWVSWVVALALAGASLWLCVRWRVFRLARPGSKSGRSWGGEPVLSGSDGLVLLASGVGLLVLASALGGGLALWLGVEAASGRVRDLALGTWCLHSVGIVLGGCLAAGLVRGGLLGRGSVAPGWRDVPRGLGALLLAGPVVVVVSAAGVEIIRRASGHDPSAIAHGTLEVIRDAPRGGWWWLLVAGAVVGAPVFEEVLFRGLLQPGLRPLVRSRWAAVLLTAGAFTLLHVPSGPEAEGARLEGLPAIGALAVALGLARERWGRLWPAIVMHAGFNAANVCLALLAG